jgi:hypothetical protein
MYKNTFIAGLTLLSVFLASATSTRAELARDINSLTIQNIERSTTNTGRSTTNTGRSTTNTERSTTNNERGSQRQIATNTQQSMRYVQQGWAAQKSGNERQALLYYYRAVKIDKTNGVAFLAAGNLLGETEEGVTCVKAAVNLFRAQGNQEGFDLAMGWLQEHGVPY